VNRAKCERTQSGLLNRRCVTRATVATLAAVTLFVLIALPGAAQQGCFTPYAFPPLKGDGTHYTDKPAFLPFLPYIHAVGEAGIMTGCSATAFCPEDPVTREDMAVWLEQASPVNGWPRSIVFGDVPQSYCMECWVGDLVDDWITAGCGNDNYCPFNLVTRAQMAVFLLKAKWNEDESTPNHLGEFKVYDPGEVTDPDAQFADIVGSPFAPWIKRLAYCGITAGCGDNNFCPESPVSRGQMAVFLEKTFLENIEWCKTGG